MLQTRDCETLRYLYFSSFCLDRIEEQLCQGTSFFLCARNPLLCCAIGENPGRLVTREELQQSVWPGTYVSESLLRGYVRDLRDALGDDAEAPRFIETIPRRGYRFLVPIHSTTLHQGLEARDWGLVPSPSLQSESHASSPNPKPQ